MVRFIADVQVGKLARLLRLLGYDTLYSNTFTMEELRCLASADGSVVLSRNPAFGRQAALPALVVKSEIPEEQLLEVDEKFGVRKNARPFTRCLHCNGKLHRVTKDDVLHLLPDNTAVYYQAFWQCESCEKVYWKGPHYTRMMMVLKRLGIQDVPEG